MASNFPRNNKRDNAKFNRTPYERPSRATEANMSQADNSSKGLIHTVKESMSDYLNNSWLGAWLTPKKSPTKIKTKAYSSIPHTSHQDSLGRPFLGQENLEEDAESPYSDEGDLEPVPSTSKDTLPPFGFPNKQKYGIPTTRHSFMSSTPASSPGPSRVTKHMSSLDAVDTSSKHGFVDDIEEVSIIANTSTGHANEERAQKATSRSIIETTRARKRIRNDDMDDISLMNQSAPQEGAMASKRPRFNFSAVGSPHNTTMPNLSDSSSSIFYAGKTMYGGANNYRRSSGTPTRVLPRHTIKPQQTSQPTEDGGLSLAAKRILDCLDKMASPLSEAKRIPTTRNRQSFFESPSYIADFHKHRPVLKTPGRSPPASKLLTPSTASIKPNLSAFIEKQALNASTMDKDSDYPDHVQQRSASSSPNVSSSFVQKETPPHFAISPVTNPLLKTSLSQSITREVVLKSVKSDSLKARVRKGVSTMDDAPLEMPDLPNVSLPVSSLPTIAFKSLPSFQPPAPINPVSSKQMTKIVSQTDNFMFSKPELLGHASDDVSEEESGVEYEFSKPICETSPKKDVSKSSISGSSTPTKPTETPLPLSLADKFKPPSGSWECSVCCVVNKKDDKKCISCSSPNPKTDDAKVISLADPSIAFQAPAPTTTALTLPSSVSSKVIGNFGNLFKKPSGQWECEVCMVNNKMEDKQCVACKSAKPNSKPEVGFGAKFISQTKDWECSVCMIKNKEKDKKCIACETPKDGGSVPEAGDVFKPNNFAFKNAGTFKFGVTKTTTSSEEKGAVLQFGSANTNSLNTEKSSTFTFGTTNSAVSKPEGTISSGFGKINSSSTQPNSGFSFGATTTKLSGSPAQATTTESSVLFATKSAEPEKSFSFGTSKSSAPSKVVSTTSISEPFTFGKSTSSASLPVASNSLTSIGTSNSSDPPSIQNTSKPFSFGTAKSSNSPATISTQTISKSSDTSIPPTPTMFAFGSKSNGVTSTDIKGATLNNNLEKVSNENVKSSPFTFGTPISSSKSNEVSASSSVQFNGLTTSSSQPSSLFTFGGGAKQPASSFSGGGPAVENTSSKATFSFGQLPSKPTNMFGSSELSSKTQSSKAAVPADTSSVFSFGSTKTNDPPTFASKTVPQSFAFGQLSEKPAPGVFAFGTSNNNETKAAGFNFGAPDNTPKVSFAFGQTPSAPPGPGLFQFQKPTFNPDTAIKKAPPAAPSTFGIPTGNPFNTLSQTESAAPTRVIRKALRRAKK